MYKPLRSPHPTFVQHLRHFLVTHHLSQHRTIILGDLNKLVKNSKISTKQGCFDVTKTWHRPKPKNSSVSSPKVDHANQPPLPDAEDSTPDSDETPRQHARRRTWKRASANKKRMHPGRTTKMLKEMKIMTLS